MFGLTKFLHDSNNEVVENPLFLKMILKPVKRAHRRLSRKQKGSVNRKKAKTRLQLLYERIRNKRTDFLHKVSTEYSEKYDIIFLERLRIPNMVRNHRLARSIIDSGWGTFKNMIAYKSKLMVEVKSPNTSVSCSRCGNKVSKSLAIRIHRCDRCGLAIDRDYNASLNIKHRGLLLLPQGLRKVTPVEILVESMKQEQAIDNLIASPRLQ
jgi:putative transposase